ncbi:hypothetical protein GF373_04250 [bacterium]|nr:hypothetical protein [bacterium]
MTRRIISTIIAVLVILAFTSLVGNQWFTIEPEPTNLPTYEPAKVRAEMWLRSQTLAGCEDFVPVPKGHPPFAPQDLTAADLLILDVTPKAIFSNPGGVETISEYFHGGYTVKIPVALALSPERDEGEYTIHWQLHGMDKYGMDWGIRKEGSVPLSAIPGRMSKTGSIEIRFRDEPGRFYVLYAWAEDKQGNLIARNFSTYTTLGDWTRYRVRTHYWEAMRSLTKDDHYHRWHPRAYQAVQGNVISPQDQEHYDVLSLQGKASVTYAVKGKRDRMLRKINAKKAHLLLEMAACPPSNKNEQKKNQPTTVEIWARGELLKTVDLPNEPKGYKGVFSTFYNVAPPFAYGYKQKIPIPQSVLHKNEPFEITIKTAEGTEGGFHIFGGYSGAYVTPPTLHYVK